ncbi:MAG: hypothetical protein AB7P07_00190 [Hyphomonadaceae bacterium]
MSAVNDPQAWLTEHQRAQCTGASALTTFQGMLCDEILVPASALTAKDPEALVGAVCSFGHAMLQQAMLLPGEFAHEALWSVHVDYYRRQVREGGHAQYIANSGWAPIPVRATGYGLKRMLADPYYDVLRDVAKLTQAEPREAKKLAAAQGHRDVPAALRALDKRFADLEREEPLTPRHRTWIKSLRKLNAVPDETLRAHMNRIVSLNPLWMARRAEDSEKHRKAAEMDPTLQAVRALCQDAGLKLQGLNGAARTPVRASWRAGPNRPGVMREAVTDQGKRIALFYADGALMKKYKAVLLEPGREAPVAEAALTRADFETIAPDL